MDDRTTYLILGRKVLSTDPHLQRILAQAYDRTERPRCLCAADGIEMCIVKDGTFYLRRMPEAGHLHHPSCAHFEPPVGLSGRSYLEGDALVETAAGELVVRSDFPLDRYDTQSRPHAASSERRSVTTSKKRLTLRGLLHLMWERAGFNRWSPAMEGKRSWGVVRRFVTEAAEHITIKGMCLSQRLFVPEPFKSEQADDIRARREAIFSRMLPGEESARHRLLLVVGEIKEMKEITLGCKLVIKHLPDCPFAVDAKLAERVLREYADAFHARDTLSGTRLIAAFTMTVRSLNDYRVDSLAIMTTTDTWIPFESGCQKYVVDALSAQRRRFIKPLDYDAPDRLPFADFLLLDVADHPVPLYILPTSAGKTKRRAKEALIAKEPESPWVWNIEATLNPPALPRKSHRFAAESQDATPAREGSFSTA